ncbi:MAG: Rne/Rng family ribonuclease [Bacteroidia bacterium]|nr:Rne/Rng family ribonuclease [Bacteroidia bacterium]
MSNELIIDVSPSHVEIALLENKKLVELNRESSDLKFAVGDIYLAKVKKIMPGLNAAFVDVGYEKDAFLHYQDLGPQFQTLNKFLKQSTNNRIKLNTELKIHPEPDIQKDGKIADILKTGQIILVQIAKEPISTKGPRLTSELSVAGRNMVLIPFSNKVSVSQKIDTTEEKSRLKKLVQSICPKNYGVIVRTAAEGKRVAELDPELQRLVTKFENALVKLEKAVAPSLILGELDRTIGMIRDLYNPDFSNIFVNNEEIAAEIKEYVGTIDSEKKKVVKHYNGKMPIFEYFGIDKQIKASFGKTVSFRSGAYLIIEHTEAFHVIDVNSGNRSKTGDQETNALEVNLAAAEEAANQLRLRDMGGIIVIDFIDMHGNENRQKVFDKMKEAMASDRTKHNILPLSKFCLMQITRQRVRQELAIETAEVCPVCKGSGKVTPTLLFIEEIEQKVRYIFEELHKQKLTIKLHPFVGAFLTRGFPSKALKWRWKYHKKVKIEEINAMSFLDSKFYDENAEEIIF